MADVISTCSQNDTSGNTSGGGEWYTTLTLWEAAAQTRFGTTPNHEIVECYNDFGGPLDDSCTIDGWVGTNQTNHPTIRVAAGQGHGGVEGAGFILRTSSTSEFQHPLQLAIDVVHVSGIEVHTRGANQWGIYASAGEGHYVDSCIFVGPGTAAANAWGFSGFGTRVSNCRFRNFQIGVREPRPSIDNCTAVGCSNGFLFSQFQGNARNCVAYGNVGTDYAMNSNVNPHTNNASEDTSAPGTNPVTGVVVGDFVDYAGGDYTPATGGNLDGAGADLSGDFTNDIAGTPSACPPTLAHSPQG
jgi:hypothetical protein